MPVQLDLSEILHNHGMRLSHDVDVPCTPELDLDCAAPVTGHLVFTNTGNLLVIQGMLSASLRNTCPRCLTDVVTTSDVPVDEEFTIEDEAVTGRADDETGMADPATAALWTMGHILDVTELARQSVVLAAPLKALCREDCLGLCPICGVNRNETQCDCKPEVDSPFAALAGLYKQGDD